MQLNRPKRSFLRSNDEGDFFKLMGRLDSGQVMSLIFLMPGLWSLYGLFSEYTLSELLIYVAVKVLVFELEVSTATILISMAGVMMFWLFFLGHLIGWQFKFWNKTTCTVRVKRRTGSRKQKTPHFRRRNLPYHLVRRCRNRPFNSPPVIVIELGNRIVTCRYTPQD